MIDFPLAFKSGMPTFCIESTVSACGTRAFSLSQRDRVRADPSVLGGWLSTGCCHRTSCALSGVRGQSWPRSPAMCLALFASGKSHDRWHVRGRIPAPAEHRPLNAAVINRLDRTCAPWHLPSTSSSSTCWGTCSGILDRMDVGQLFPQGRIRGARDRDRPFFCDTVSTV